MRNASSHIEYTEKTMEHSATRELEVGRALNVEAIPGCDKVGGILTSGVTPADDAVLQNQTTSSSPKMGCSSPGHSRFYMFIFAHPSNDIPIPNRSRKPSNGSVPGLAGTSVT